MDLAHHKIQTNTPKSAEIDTYCYDKVIRSLLVQESVAPSRPYNTKPSKVFFLVCSSCHPSIIVPMVASGPSAANVCLPPESPVVASHPPLPSPTRGVRCPISGTRGRLPSTAPPSLVYASNKQVVLTPLDRSTTGTGTGTGTTGRPLVYRGHLHPVTACQAAPSGAYMASADHAGTLKIWALDTSEHLTKYEGVGLLSGPIRDVAWDVESKRLAIGGERSDAMKSSDCAKAIAWDGVSAGTLAQMTKGRVSSVAFKPTRPFRIAIAGMDEPKIMFHQGPPFARIPPQNGIPHETAHTRGGIPAIRYSPDGQYLVSVGVDRSLCLYDGKTLELLHRSEQLHTATVYDAAFDAEGKRLLTCSGDGTCQLLEIVVSDGGDAKVSLQPLQSWNVAQHQSKGVAFAKVPVGAIQLGCTFCGETPVSISLNGQVAVLSRENNNDQLIDLWTGHIAPIAALTLDLQSGHMYTGDTNGVLCQWDLGTLRPLQRLTAHDANGNPNNPDLMYVVHGATDRPAAVSGVATIVDTQGQTLLYSVGWDDQLYITQNGIVRSTSVPLGAQPRCIGAGTHLAVIATVKGLWVVRDGQLTTPNPTPLSFEPQAVCVSPKDTVVYVGGSDCKIHIYSLAPDGALSETHVIDGKHLKPLHSLALSPDGSKLAAGDEKDVCVYNVQDSYATLIGRGRWCFHLQRITCLTWSPDSTVLASGGADDSIYLWNVDKKTTRVHYPFAHRGGLSGLAFVGERELVSTGLDSVVHRWDVRKDVTEKLL